MKKYLTFNRFVLIGVIALTVVLLCQLLASVLGFMFEHFDVTFPSIFSWLYQTAPLPIMIMLHIGLAVVSSFTLFSFYLAYRQRVIKDHWLQLVILPIIFLVILFTLLYVNYASITFILNDPLLISLRVFSYILMLAVIFSFYLFLDLAFVSLKPSVYQQIVNYREKEERAYRNEVNHQTMLAHNRAIKAAENRLEKEYQAKINVALAAKAKAQIDAAHRAKVNLMAEKATHAMKKQVQKEEKQQMKQQIALIRSNKKTAVDNAKLDRKKQQQNHKIVLARVPKVNKPLEATQKKNEEARLKAKAEAKKIANEKKKMAKQLVSEKKKADLEKVRANKRQLLKKEKEAKEAKRIEAKRQAILKERAKRNLKIDDWVVYHLAPHPEFGWQLKKANAKNPTKTFERQNDALNYALKMIHNHDNVKIFLHDTHGKFKRFI